MAFGSLLALLDDISTVLDDIALMTKVAAKKTAGVLGDDLAINAEQVSSASAEREIPVVLAVMKGSFVNKLILVPLALVIATLAPSLLTVLLMIGGAYLCFEGVEKVLEAIKHLRHKQRAVTSEADRYHDHNHIHKNDLSEKERIKGAVRTDFVLSAEIITISLGVMTEKTLLVQASALALVAVVMTIGVYGLVAGIVKLDDLGFWMMKKRHSVAKALGRGLITATPWLMRGLGIVGTAAMFLVGGGIITHGVPAIGEHLHHVAFVATAPAWLGNVISIAGNVIVGLLVGSIIVVLVTAARRIRKL